jgi:hypothetical protein
VTIRIAASRAKAIVRDVPHTVVTAQHRHILRNVIVIARWRRFAVSVRGEMSFAATPQRASDVV